MNKRLAFALFPLAAGVALTTSPVRAQAPTARIVIGAPPDANYQEFSYDGVATRPPRGYSPGYGWAPDSLKYPSLVITNAPPPPPQVIVAPAPGPELVVPPNAVVFRVRVPADADVLFSGERTAQRGVDRVFMTPPLVDGKALVFEVQAHWKQDGKDVGQTRKLAVRPGDRVSVDFFQPDANAGEALPVPRPVGKP